MGGTPVHANELDTFVLDEYVVTAARTETKLVDTPANITIVGAEEIESKHYKDVNEVLKDVPGASLVDNGLGNSEKNLFLNGDNRVLVLVDGRRVNVEMGSTFGHSFDMNLMPPVETIERVEVLKGAGGALYGSEAVGGVVNIITKKTNKNYGKVSIGFGSNDARNMSAMYSFKQGKTGVTVSAAKEKQAYYKYKDILNDRTTRWPDPSDYQNEKVSLKLEQEINDGSNLTIGYDYSKYEGNNTYDVTGDYNAALDKKSKQFYAKYDWLVGEKDQGYVQVYRNEMEYNNFSATSAGFFDEETNGVDLQQVFTVSENNKLVSGVSWREASVDAAGTHVYNGEIENIAFFLNDTWEFAPTWSLVSGVRYDDHDKAGDETTFSAGLNKKFDDNSHAYINWGQVFNTPTVFQFYYPSGGNESLKPETGDTWTIGYNTSIGERTNVGVSYFESDLEDAIAWNDPDTWMGPIPGEYDNVDKQKNKGFELNLTHELNDNLELSASYTYIKTKKNTGGVWSRDLNVLPNMYRAGIHYKDGKWDSNLWLRAGSGASSAKYVDSKYVTLDMTVTYNATKDLKFFAKGYNLLNEAYAEQGGLAYRYDAYYNPIEFLGQAYPAQSRRFLIGAEYSF